MPEQSYPEVSRRFPNLYVSQHPLVQHKITQLSEMRTTTATLVSKSVTAIAADPSSDRDARLARSCVRAGGDPDRALERAREVRLVAEAALRGHIGE